MTAGPETAGRVSAGPATAILSGVDTLVRLLQLRHQLDQRDGLTTATMVSGYPGSPLGAFDLALDGAGKKTLSAHRIIHQPGLNEELAAAVVWGSQMGAVIPYDGIDGVAGAWYGKGPGLDRSGDVLKHANAMGAGPNGGAVAFCGDDPLAKSSTLPCDSQYTFEDACIPVLYPGDQQDILDLGVHAFRMSRFAGSWVGLKVVTSVADGIGTVDLDLDRHVQPELSGVTVAGRPWRHRPLAAIGPHQIPDQEELVMVGRLAAAKAYARQAGLDRVYGAPVGAPLGVICAGKTYFDVLEAFSLEELAAAGVRVLKLAMTYPLVDDTVLEFAASVDELVVIEEKRPFIETQLRAILHENGSRVPVLGKRDRSGRKLTSSTGELDARAVTAILGRVRPEIGAVRVAAGSLPAAPRTSLPLLQLPGRPPGYCSGCPHNRSTLVPDGALAGGGVGCHGIMYFEARQADTRRLPPPPMGAEGAPWIGLSPFVDEPHLIQNLGDGTMSHSGTLAIRASVAAGVNVTFKILYNGAVAMTGGQDVTGLMEVPALTRALEAEGVSKIIVCAEEPGHYGRRARWARGTEVLGRDHLPEVQERLRATPGVTAVIYDQRCAAQSRRLRKRGQLAAPSRRVFINEAVCEGCGDCGVQSNCLSVLPLSTEFGDKREIHDPSCNRDYTCLEGDCPSFVTIKPRPHGTRRPRAADSPRATTSTTSTTSATSARPALPSGSLPVPSRPAAVRRYGIYFTGIGGTG
ncbi:MAG: indolepyruvate ferredoxin oxidoreductase family protein, partial [Trebonia sp.]